MSENNNDLIPAESAADFEWSDLDDAAYDEAMDALRGPEAAAVAEQDHVEEDPSYWEHYGFSPVEQGMYDDDPNPYHGDYAEDDGY